MLGIDIEGQPAGLRRSRKANEKRAMAGINVKLWKATHGEITLDLFGAADPVAEER